jgi:hypothetical protein
MRPGTHSVPGNLLLYVSYGMDTRRMNTVANGMFWELGRPLDLAEVDPDDGIAYGAAAADQDPAVRQIKMRGTAAFLTGRQLVDLAAGQGEVLAELRRLREG